MVHGSVNFKESQRLTPFLTVPSVLFFVGLAVYLAAVQLIGGTPVGDSPASDGELVFLILLTGLGLPALLLGTRMTTTVDQTELVVRFFPFKTLRVPLLEIDSYWVRNYHWLKDYGGIGIRRGLDGWAYIMRGDQGVQVQRRGGSRVLIGTQKPDELIQALRMVTGLQAGDQK